ncbi:endoglucanase [Anaerolineales bacterium]|nr:endoglucanase [Anaerolineales bacterium]
MDTAALLKQLSQTSGISGHEAPIRSVILAEWGRYAAETRVDKLGNAIAIKSGTETHSERTLSEQSESKRKSKDAKRPPTRRIMLASHMDEIGLMVAGINRGFIRVTALGGVDPRVLLGQEVIVHGRKDLPGKDLPGVIASTPPHLLKAGERDKIIGLEKLWIDVGLSARQVTQRVEIGDLISMRRTAVELKNGLLAGKAFDNRASVAAVTVCLEQLQTLNHMWDVVAVATVQEETALLGATTAAFGLSPDAAIVIDTTYGTQSGTSADESFDVGGGPTIGIGPNMHPRMTQRMRDAAKRLELTAPLEPMAGNTGTDAWVVQVAGEGIPTGLLGIPIRSMHTPVETVSPRDVERAGRLLAEFIAGLDEEFYQSLTEG